MNKPDGPEKARLFDIQKCSFVDGPGIRTTVFFKGCNLSCAWCHNPESQRFDTELMVYQDKCVHCGKCLEKCPHHLRECTLCGTCALYCPKDARKVCGKDYTVEEVWEEIRKDKAFYASSGGGATFSGGECMLQIGFLEKILSVCRENGVSAAVDTAGHVPFSLFERILPLTDLFLYDIKMMDQEKHLRYTGVDNTLILQNLKNLLQRGCRVRIRIPVLAGINDDVEEMTRIRDFLQSYGIPELVELLPYHKLGEMKYRALGQTPESFSAPSEETMQILRSIFDGLS